MNHLKFLWFLALIVHLTFAVSGGVHATDSGSGGQTLVKKIASFANKAIYNLDEDQLKAVLENYLQEHPDIIALSVTEAIDQEELLTYFRQDNKAVYGQPIPGDLLKLDKYSAASLFEGEAIGTVDIYYANASAFFLNDDEQAWIVDHPVISVGLEEWFPFVRTEKNGTPGGIAGDFIGLVLKKTGLKIEVISDEWSTLLSDFVAGKIDLLPATYFTDKRATFGRYSNPYFSAREFLYIRKNDGSVRSFNDLDGKKLAVVKGFGTIPKIREKFPHIEIVETKNQLSSIYAVLNEEVDALFESQIVINDLARRELITGLRSIGQTSFKASSLYFFSRLDEPLLQSILTKALDDVSEAERRELIDKWVAHQNDADGNMELQIKVEFDQANFILQYIAIVFALILAICIAAWYIRGRPTQLTIREVLFIVFFVFAGLIVSIGSLVTMLLEGQQEQSSIENRNIGALNLGLELKQSSDDLTRFARTLAVTGDPKYENYYQAIVAIRDGRRPHPKNHTRSYWDQVAAGIVDLDEEGKTYSIKQKMLDLSFSEDEQEKLFQAKNESDVLINLETISMNAVRGRFKDASGAFSIEGNPNLEMARQLLHGKEYHDAKARIMKPIDEFFTLLEWRTTSELNHVREKNKAIILAITAFTVITIIFAVYAFFMLKRRIITPLSRLEAGATRLKLGDYSNRVDISTNDEVGTLAHSFNSMARGIEERTNEIAEKEKLLRAALDNMSSGIFMIDENNKVVLLNEQYIKMYHLPNDLIAVGGSPETVLRFQAERGDFGEGDVEVTVDRIMDNLTGAKSMGYERQLFDGTIVDINISPTPDGSTVIVYNDITSRKLAENKFTDAFEIISSSINYASRIQRSILPDEGVLSSVVRDHFILWEPRDVVGGDIYWHGAWGSGCLIIVGDCTGHGVPGAFMTLIAIGALERAMSEIEGGDVGNLVSRIHQYIQVSLSQHYDGGGSDDGIELGACYFVPEEREMTFVGARFELFINKSGDISTIKGTKAGMGYRGIPYDQEYQENTIFLGLGDSYYLTTDGLIDQVGGERKRMFGKKRFKDLLIRVQGKPFSVQKELILQSLRDYQGKENRRDDVSVTGFQI